VERQGKARVQCNPSVYRRSGRTTRSLPRRGARGDAGIQELPGQEEAEAEILVGVVRGADRRQVLDGIDGRMTLGKTHRSRPGGSSMHRCGDGPGRPARPPMPGRSSSRGWHRGVSHAGCRTSAPRRSAPGCLPRELDRPGIGGLAGRPGPSPQRCIDEPPGLLRWVFRQRHPPVNSVQNCRRSAPRTTPTSISASASSWPGSS